MASWPTAPERRNTRIAFLTARGLSEREATITADLSDHDACRCDDCGQLVTADRWDAVLGIGWCVECEDEADAATRAMLATDHLPVERAGDGDEFEDGPW